MQTSQLLKKFYQFKFTLIYSVGFFVLGGVALAIPALASGLLVDWIMNKCRNNRKDYPIKYWFIYVGIIGVLYPIIVFSSIDPDTHNGLVYTWINFTKPFTDAMANLVPAIDVYAKQIAAFGDSWRVPKFRHLYALFWFTNIVAAPFLYGDIWRWIKHLMNQPLENFRHKDSKDNPKWLKKYNYIVLGLTLSFGVIAFFMLDSFFGSNLPHITYLKGKYFHLPFILFGAVIICFMGIILFIVPNIKNIKQRGNHRV